MSQKMQLVKRDRVTVRGDATEIPLHICLETLNEIPGDLRYYHENLAIEVGDVLLVQDAP